MNAWATFATGAPLADRAAETAPPRNESHTRGHAAGRQHRDAFERALRDRAARHENDDAGCGATPPDAAAGSAAGAAGAAMSSLRQTAATAQGGVTPAAALSDAVKAAASVVLEATATTDAHAPAALAGNADAAGVWEASVHEPSGVAIEMRVMRAAGGAGTQPAWTLTIASPTVDASVLARHAPRLSERLNERLRGRELTHTHVRIERDDEEAA
ncbi:MAG TPA: hypothetical protein VFR86_08045 [Burkholderiaceae bacterium]|nr:hypothetical protein [Burkholderiaceae bacterium]